VLTTQLDGKDGKLDGVIFTRSCDGMRRLYDVWKSYLDTGFIYMLEAPKNHDETAVGYYAAQLQDLAGSIGRAFNRQIDSSALSKAIREINKSRRAMHDIFIQQQSSPLPVKGSELFELGLNLICGEDGLDVHKLPEVYRKLRQVNMKGKDKRQRILVSGNVMDRSDLLEMIEEAGADVSVADLCTAFRHFDRDVDEKTVDPYMALAKAYLSEPHCARTGSPAQRMDELKLLVQAYKIDGVVLTSVKFCDFQLYDAPYLMKELAGAGTPVLFLENDYTFSSKSQLKVRVEAFIEMLAQGGK